MNETPARTAAVRALNALAQHRAAWPFPDHDGALTRLVQTILAIDDATPAEPLWLNPPPPS